VHASFRRRPSPSWCASSVTNNVNLQLRYNIAPTEDIAVVRPDLGGTGRRLDMLRWGLVQRLLVRNRMAPTRIPDI
jgi:putative SOS response-associated peptidase YedK